MNTAQKLLITGMLPVVMSVILHYIFKQEKYQNINPLRKQIFIGIVFGILAIVGTEFGVPITGAIINARDAAPLCAGLIFGGPAGIIAGLIGGVERWFAVYWGAGMYTRLGCTISTILAGIIAAMLRMRIFDDKTPDTVQAFVAGVVIETIHMLMIFITNISDIKQAFTFVEACSIPMITINAVAVGLAVFVIDRIEWEEREDKNTVPTITSRFQRILIMVVIACFIVTSLFTLFLQQTISRSDTEFSLSLTLSEAVNDLILQTDETLLQLTKQIANELRRESDVDLNVLADAHDVSEINIINADNIIIASNEIKNIGFNMNSGEQSREFVEMMKESTEYVQAYQPISRDSDIWYKYAAVSYKDGYVQAGYSSADFHDDLEEKLENLTLYRNVGISGDLMVVDENGYIVSDYKRNFNMRLKDLIPDFDHNKTVVYTLTNVTYNNERSYLMYTETEGYLVIAVLPAKEADFNKRLSIYLILFMEIIVFGALFAQIIFAIKMGVVKNIDDVNGSLSEITDGNLDTTVDVRENQEFVSLSDGINMTVDALKHFIKEANERIDSELRYAKEIQFSALPTTFPAFPDRNEFDIYALMNPAKEVGGDFYDFYIINGNILAFLVADVSGKGIPASLFMMRAKTTIKSYAENGIAVADIFTNANYHLAEGNDAGMFVTAWMGMLNLETGELKYANAGHNRPLLKRKNGQYEYLKGPAGFVLAGMEGIAYKEQQLVLEPGDEIFLYTDGVVEATNVDKELYGDDRLLEMINSIGNADCQTICEKIEDDVDKFYDGAPQFDDITEMSLKFIKYTGTK